MAEKMTKRQMQHQVTLEAIRAAVDQLVDEVGFEKMTIRNVCGRVGITIGAFYHYFPSKNDLLIDRYRRTNANLSQYYEDELKGIHPVDALKSFLLKVVDYNRSRVIKMMIPYYKTLLEECVRWSEIEERMITAIPALLVEEGLASGKIRSTYTRDEILSFLECFLNGIGATQCMTKGGLLKEERTFKPVMDWLETLRNE